VGLYLLIKLRFFFVLHPIRTAKMLFRSLENKKSRGALALALAGTLGVGNIFGVCAGIMVGGAGCVFWMLLSALFSMVIKYSECVLAHDALTSQGGGMHLVIFSTFSRFGRFLAPLYALLCTALALFMGSAMQSSAVSGVAVAAFDLNPTLTAIILVILLLIGVARGSEKIEKITAKLIPLTTIFYILLTFSVIFVNIAEIPRVVRDILSSAFTPNAACGGILSYFTSNAIREGYARGILSNEAGVGTSSLAHTRASERSAVESGVCGIVEVFFDTVLLCMLTALALLSSGVSLVSGDPMSAITNAVTSSLSDAFALPLTLSILVFAYSTIICWYYYGTECVYYLFGKRARVPFAFAFFAFLVLGALISVRPLVTAIDFLLLSMCILTLSAIVARHERIFALSYELTRRK
jgi:AGCS family alanine or glycine:cation symporter